MWTGTENSAASDVWSLSGYVTLQEHRITLISSLVGLTEFKNGVVALTRDLTLHRNSEFAQYT